MPPGRRCPPGQRIAHPAGMAGRMSRMRARGCLDSLCLPPLPQSRSRKCGGDRSGRSACQWDPGLRKTSWRTSGSPRPLGGKSEYLLLRWSVRGLGGFQWSESSPAPPATTTHSRRARRSDVPARGGIRLRPNCRLALGCTANNWMSSPRVWHSASPAIRDKLRLSSPARNRGRSD